MATETPLPPPPLPQVPQWIVTLLTLALGTIKSPLLHIVLTGLLSAFGTVFAVKQALPSMLPSIPRGIIPSLPKRPWKAEDAIGNIAFGNSGCTATIIGPVGVGDSKLDILTAAHCVKVGAVGTMTLKDGRKLSVKCVSRDPNSDAAWLVAEHPGGDVPNLLLADHPPQDGEAIWHQGYGIHRPGNRESGLFRGMASGLLQCRFRLSVSPGDSGGGIILDSDSKVISPVCCTTNLKGVGDVFGASPIAAAKIRPKRTTEAEEPLLHYPILPIPEGEFPAEVRRTIGDKLP